MVVIFSAISVHSILYNRASPLAFDTARSVGASLAQEPEDGPITHIVDNTGNESSSSISSIFESSGHQQLFLPVEASGQTPFAVAENIVTPNIHLMYNRPKGAVGVDIGVSASQRLPQLDGTVETAQTIFLEENSNRVSELERIFSLRPVGQPLGFGMAVDRDRTMRVEFPLGSPSPAFSIRPRARPSTLMVSVAGSLPPEQMVQTDMVTAAVFEALMPLPQADNERGLPREALQPIRSRGSTRERLGTVLGLFETNTRRWALVESISGRIIILEPGDKVGSGIVSSISNGSMQISYEGSLGEYHIGDGL